MQIVNASGQPSNLRSEGWPDAEDGALNPALQIEDPSAEINAIRQRAYGAGFTPHVNGNVAANMNAILNEYLREFIGEGKRWWALRRAGDSYVYANLNPTYFSPTTTAKFLLPLSLTMLNNDPLLTQTPGY